MTNLIPIEWKNERIMITKTLAECYETEENNIKLNFNRNKSRFVEGKHYYLLKGEDLKEFKNQVTDSNLVPKRTASLYLWTERGVARHAKILDTDKAWEVYEQLEDTYFKVQEMKQEVKQMSDMEILSRAVLISQETIKQLTTELNEKTEYIDNMYIDLAIKVESILKERYGCREAAVCVLEGYYTRKELLKVLDNVMYYS